MKSSVWTLVARSTTAALALALPSALAAQECKINDTSPYQINGAKQYIQQAANTRYPNDVPKFLQNAVRVLTDNPEKISNETGRQFLLVRAYAQWLQRENAQYIMKRGDLGFTTNPQGDHNLLLAVDSAAAKVLSAMPQCAATVNPYRLKFFGEIMNKAVTALNADQLDSAAFYSRLSLQASANDPRPWNVLNAVYAKREQNDSSMYAMRQVIALSGTDTIYTKVKQQSRYNLAVMMLGRADGLEGDAKTKEITAARALLEDYLKDSPGDATATQALGRALRMSGDTAAVAKILDDMVSKPENFTEIQLFEAASNAALSKQDDDAVKLFEAGLKKNPYHRVALLNFANVLFTMKDAERMGPAVRRVIDLDPNYGNALRLMGGYFQLRAQKETDAAKKKVLQDSVLYYLQLEDKLAPRVDINLAAKNGNTFEVQGSITNPGQAAGSWTMKLELLDATGKVVATKDVAVGPVEAGGSSTFAVKIEAPTAVGYRYAPIK